MNPNQKNLLLWTICSVALALLLAIPFAHAPATFKRLVLTYLMFGVVCGWAMSWLAGELQLSITKSMLLIACLSVAAGTGHLAWQSFQQLKIAKQAEIQRDPEQLAMLNMMEKIAGEEHSAEYEARRRQLQPEFMDYFSFRVSSLGSWPQPWPLLFWALEVSLAVGVSGWMLSQSNRL